MTPLDTLADKWLSFGLAFVGGYGDASGLVLAGTFTGHVTGNLVLVAVSVSTHEWRATLGHLLAIVTFLTGVFLSVLITRLLNAWPPRSFLPSIMGIEMILIAAASLALSSHAAIHFELFVFCVSLALGLQNGAFRRAGGISVHTTYLTGMITRLITTEAGNLVSQAPPRPASLADPKITVLGGIWASFLAGAVAGAAMVLRFKERSILGAAVVLFLMIVLCWFPRSPDRTGN